ncbi:MAG: SUMF1/EgtB/PvdO family nonheme iron enzyme [Planctomycetota bacterium]|nr:SUMF1/EgtB/PvdO family nonheme iron enzyme [Planctomycetota bacterium]
MGGIVKCVAVVVLLLAVVAMAGCGDDANQEEGLAANVLAFLDGWATPIGEDRHAATGFPLRILRSRDEAEMVLVPGGRFQMGAVPQDKTALDDEKPRHAVVVAPFYMDLNEVTRGQFAMFVEATEYVTEVEKIGKGGYAIGRPPEPMGEFGHNWRSSLHGGELPYAPDDHPVTQVNWRDATAYARWAGVVLPCEDQFEFVLRRGKEGLIYPWGNELAVDPARANLAGEELIRRYPGFKKYDPEGSQFVRGHEDPFPWTAPVRSFAPDYFGLYDISGNVSEWCKDAFLYYDDPDEVVDPEEVSRVMRGGSWRSHHGRVRCSWRTSADPQYARDYWGFRCAKPLPEPEDEADKR